MIESLDLGGAEKSLVTLLQNLDYTKYNVILLLIKKEGLFNKFVPKEVYVIHFDIFKGVSFIRKLITRLHFWIQRKVNTRYNTTHFFWQAYGINIPKHTKQYDIAIAYSQGFATYFVADKINARKKYAWLNTDYIKAGYNAKYDKIFYARFNKIIAVSEVAKESIINAFKDVGYIPEIKIIKDITDSFQVKALAIKPIKEHLFNFEKINLVSVGRLAKPKGFELAITACKIIVKEGFNINWYIIGEGSERDALEKLIEVNNLNKNFFLLGFQENPYPYIKACDIYVQTSLFEGLGLTVIEAAILQKPIVSTNFPTASTIITHNKTGLICEMNATAIADSIIKYIENPKLRDVVIANLQSAKNNDKEISLQKINNLLSS